MVTRPSRRGTAFGVAGRGFAHRKCRPLIFWNIPTKGDRSVLGRTSANPCVGSSDLHQE